MTSKKIRWVLVVLFVCIASAFLLEAVHRCSCYNFVEMMSDCEYFCEDYGGCKSTYSRDQECFAGDCWNYYEITCKSGLKLDWFSIFPDCDDCEEPEE